MAQKEYLQIKDVGGGMDAKTDAALLQYNQCRKIINGDLGRLPGAISKRFGYELQGSAATPATNVLGMGALAIPGTPPKIVVACGSDYYIYDNIDEEWDAQGQTISGEKVEFKTYLDHLFSVDYDTDTKTYDGTDWSTTVNLSAADGSPSGAPRAKYVEVYQNKVYLANVVIQPNSYQSRVYRSSLPNTDYEIDWDTTEGTGQYFEADTNDNDVIRGLGVGASRLLIFKEYSLHIWDNYSRQKIEGAPGTNSHRSIKTIGDWTYYFNRRGVYRFNGSYSEYISEPVAPYIEGISAASSYGVCAGEKDLHYLLYIGEVTNDKEDIVERRVMLDFDTTKNPSSGWSIHVLQTRPSVFLSAPTGAF